MNWPSVLLVLVYVYYDLVSVAQAVPLSALSAFNLQKRDKWDAKRWTSCQYQEKRIDQRSLLTYSIVIQRVDVHIAWQQVPGEPGITIVANGGIAVIGTIPGIQSRSSTEDIDYVLWRTFDNAVDIRNQHILKTAVARACVDLGVSQHQMNDAMTGFLIDPRRNGDTFTALKKISVQCTAAEYQAFQKCWPSAPSSSDCSIKFSVHGEDLFFSRPL